MTYLEASKTMTPVDETQKSPGRFGIFGQLWFQVLAGTLSASCWVISRPPPRWR